MQAFESYESVHPLALGFDSASALTKQIGTRISVSNSLMNSNVSARGVKFFMHLMTPQSNRFSPHSQSCWTTFAPFAP